MIRVNYFLSLPYAIYNTGVPTIFLLFQGWHQPVQTEEIQGATP